MTMKYIDGEFTVCKTEEAVVRGDFCFVGKTDKETSLVCQTENVPEKTIEREDGWAMFRVEGKLDFSLVGILSSVTTALAKENVPVFAISTFDTDYILIKRENLIRAKNAFLQAGYEIEE